MLLILHTKYDDRWNPLKWLNASGNQFCFWIGLHGYLYFKYWFVIFMVSLSIAYVAYRKCRWESIYVRIAICWHLVYIVHRQLTLPKQKAINLYTVIILGQKILLSFLNASHVWNLPNMLTMESPVINFICDVLKGDLWVAVTSLDNNHLASPGSKRQGAACAPLGEAPWGDASLPNWLSNDPCSPGPHDCPFFQLYRKGVQLTIR